MWYVLHVTHARTCTHAQTHTERQREREMLRYYYLYVVCVCVSVCLRRCMCVHTRGSYITYLLTVFYYPISSTQNKIILSQTLYRCYTDVIVLYRCGVAVTGNLAVFVQICNYHWLFDWLNNCHLCCDYCVLLLLYVVYKCVLPFISLHHQILFVVDLSCSYFELLFF